MAVPSHSTCNSLETRSSESSALCCHLWACLGTTSHLGSLQLMTFCPYASRIASNSQSDPRKHKPHLSSKTLQWFPVSLEKNQSPENSQQSLLRPGSPAPPGRVLSSPASSLGSSQAGPAGAEGHPLIRTVTPAPLYVHMCSPGLCSGVTMSPSLLYSAARPLLHPPLHFSLPDVVY